MKRIIWSLIGVAAVSLAVLYYLRARADYNREMNRTIQRLGLDRTTAMLAEDWKYDHGHFPDSLKLLYDTFIGWLPKYEAVKMEYAFCTDYLSREKKWVSYIPLYSEDGTVVESFILLSAGIDGKLDNMLSDGVKLHRSDWKQKLQLYNPDEFVDSCLDMRNVFGGNTFKLWDYWFGKKDLLMFTWDELKSGTWRGVISDETAF